MHKIKFFILQYTKYSVYNGIIALIPLLYSLYYTSILENSQLLAAHTKLSILILCLIAIAKKENKLTINSIDIFITLFILWICFVTLYKKYDYKELYPISILGTYYFLIRQTINHKNLSIFLKGISIISFIVAFYAVFQYLGISNNSIYSKFKNTSFFIHPASLAGYLVITFPILIYVVSKSKKITHLITYVILTIIYLVVILECQSRASVLALLLSIIGAIIIKFNYFIFKTKKGWLSLLLLSVMLLFSAYSLYYIRPISALGRLFVWKISSQIISENPLLGIGYGQFNQSYIKYQASYFLNDGSCYERLNAQLVLYPFNEFIRVMIESGGIGLFFFIALLIACFYQLSKSKFNNLRLLIICSLISFLIFSFFSYSFDILPLSLLFITSIALIGNLTTKTSYKVSQYLIPTILIFILILPVNDFIKAKQWDESMHDINHKNTVVKNLSKLYSSFRNYGPFLCDYGSELVKDKNYQEATLVLERSTKLQFEFNQYQLLAFAYIQNNQLEKANNIYEYLYLAEPSDLIPLYNLLLIELNINKNKKKISNISRRILDIKCFKQTKQNIQIRNICYNYLLIGK